MSEDLVAHYEALKESDRRDRQGRLKQAEENPPPGRWRKPTPYHWIRTLNGSELHYWPSTGKYRWRGRTRRGGINEFIATREAAANRANGRGS